MLKTLKSNSILLKRRKEPSITSARRWVGQKMATFDDLQYFYADIGEWVGGWVGLKNPKTH